MMDAETFTPGAEPNATDFPSRTDEWPIVTDCFRVLHLTPDGRPDVILLLDTSTGRTWHLHEKLHGVWQWKRIPTSAEES